MISKIVVFFVTILLIPVLLLFSLMIMDGIVSEINEKAYIGTEKIVLNLAENEKILNIKEGATIVKSKNGKTTYTGTFYILSSSFLYRIDAKSFSIIKKIDLKPISNNITNFYVYSYFSNHVYGDTEHIYLADNENKRIAKIDEHNHISYLTGNGFHNLIDIDVDGSNEDHIRVLDGNRVVVLNERGAVLFEHDGSKTANGLPFDSPKQIWGYKYVFDRGNHRIRKIHVYTKVVHGTKQLFESDEGSPCNSILPKKAGMINKAIYLTMTDVGNKKLIVVSNNLCTSTYITNIELQRVPYIGIKLHAKDKILIVYNDERNALYLATMNYDLLRKIKHKIEDMLPEFNPHA